MIEDGVYDMDLLWNLQIGCLYGCDAIASPGGLAVNGYGEFHRFVVICYIMWNEKKLYDIIFGVKACS